MIPWWTLILWMLGCYSSTAVRQQKRRDRRSRSSIFGLLDSPSPQIADVLPPSMSTPQSSMILGSPAQHHEETCRRARQVYSRYGTASEASVDDHGAMVSHGHTFDDCRPALLQNSGLTAACQADTLARLPVGCCSDQPEQLIFDIALLPYACQAQSALARF